MEVIFGKLWLMLFCGIILSPMLYKILSEDLRFLNVRVLSILSVFVASLTDIAYMSAIILSFPNFLCDLLLGIKLIAVLGCFVCVFYLVHNELKSKFLQYVKAKDWVYLIPALIETATLVFLCASASFTKTADPVYFAAFLSLYFVVNFYILLGAWLCYKTYLFNLDFDIKYLARKHFLYYLVMCLMLFLQQMIFTDVSYPLTISIFLLFNYSSRNRTLISQDALSGVNNRVSFNKFVNNAFVNREHKGAFLVFMDVDKFKQINDTYGHLEGDAAISLVGKTLKSIAGESNSFVARIGGDEFVMVVHSDSESYVNKIIDSVSYELEERLIFSDKQYEVRLSTGYVYISPEEHNIKSVIAMADEKMYEQKMARKRMEQSVVNSDE